MAGIGDALMGRILEVTEELRAHVRDEFAPLEGVYRIGCGEYASEQDWRNVWAGHPA